MRWRFSTRWGRHARRCSAWASAGTVRSLSTRGTPERVSPPGPLSPPPPPAPAAPLIELPGQDHLPFVGEPDTLLDEIEESLPGSRATPAPDRVLATILFTDIVRSTERAATAGDRRWRELLDDHDRMATRQVHRFGGRQIKTTGDGMVATFNSPARAIECGLALGDGARQLGLDIRVGIHTGEVERRGDDLAGMSVHIAARVESAAEPGEVWVSRTVTDLVTGSGLTFGGRGEAAVKGVPGTWQLFAVGA